MAYFSTDRGGLGEFGCGADCSCKSCRSASNLGEVYEKEEIPPPAAAKPAAPNMGGWFGEPPLRRSRHGDISYTREPNQSIVGSAPAPAVPSPRPRVPPPSPPAPARNEAALVRNSIARGITGLNQLSNAVFLARHPELRGRPLRRDEHALIREWIEIRDQVVRPLLSAGAPPRSPVSTAPAPNRAEPGARPGGALGAIVARVPGQPAFKYRFTPEDALWTARMLEGEAGGRDDLDNLAVIWAMINRYAFFTHRNYPTFSQFIRAYSTPLQPVLRSWRAAQRHAHTPGFVRTGGTYDPPAPPGLPKGQTRRHLDLQARSWNQLSPGARALTERVLRGEAPSPIGTASEFLSTRIIFKQNHGGREPNPTEWREFTTGFKRNKGFQWIGDVPNLNQMKNAFFTRTLRVRSRDPASPRYADLPPNTVQVVRQPGE